MVIDVQILLYSIAFVALAVASYHDWKTREVADWLSYALLGSALGLRLLFSVDTWNWWILAEGIAGFTVFFLLGCLFYYSGQWGGGDSKLLMGVGAIIGFELSFQTIPLVALYFLFSLFAGAGYGLLWIIVLSIKHFSRVSKEFVKEYTPFRFYGRLLLIFSGALAVFSFYLPLELLPLSIAVAFFPSVGFHLWIFVRSVEKIAFYKRVLPVNLTEGDWIADSIRVAGNVVVQAHGTGVTREQIGLLKKLHARGKVSTILIKEGIPFVPSFFFGFVCLLVYVYLI